MTNREVTGQKSRKKLRSGSETFSAFGMIQHVFAGWLENLNARQVINYSATRSLKAAYHHGASAEDKSYHPPRMYDEDEQFLRFFVRTGQR